VGSTTSIFWKRRL